MAAEDIIVDFYTALLGGQVGNLVVAVIILLLGFVIGRIAKRMAGKLLHEIELDKNLKKAGVKVQLENLLSSCASYLIYFIAIISALNQFGIVTPVFNIVLGGLVLFIAAAALLAVKDFIPNLFSGLYIFRTDLIKEGDNIKLRNLTGVVEQMTLTKTKIRTKSNDLVIVPNSSIIKSQITKLKE
jgi:small conductance mechanosensitive channel